MFHAVSVGVLSVCITVPTALGAQPETIAAAISRNTGGEVTPASVSATPVPGIFEVTSDLDVFYTDATGRYVFVDGRLVDTVEKRDLTQARLDNLTSIPFADLPLNLAIKTVRGDGSRRLAVFEDPTCPVCRSMQQTLRDLDNVTVYAFTYPVVSPGSIPAAVATWCGPESRRESQWRAYMDGAPAPDHIAPACEKAMQVVKRIVEFGHSRSIRNTPTIVLEDGRRVVGAMPIDQLDEAVTRATARISRAASDGGPQQ